MSRHMGIVVLRAWLVKDATVTVSIGPSLCSVYRLKCERSGNGMFVQTLKIYKKKRKTYPVNGNLVCRM